MTPQQRITIRKIAQSLGIVDLNEFEIAAIQERAARMFKSEPERAAIDIYKSSIRGSSGAQRKVESEARRALAQTPVREDNNLRTFAATVNAAAKASRTGRFGDNKVFINHVYRKLKPGTTLEAFKRHLVEAHRAGYVNLSRADLVEAMNPRDVEESAIRYLGSTEWNFVRIQ